MTKIRLSVDLLPKGAWGNNLSKTLPKKDWDTLRQECYKRAKYNCQICGKETIDLDAHEEWDFDIRTQTQTLKNIIALCSACHGVKHMRHSQLIGYGDNAKRHFLRVNNCDEMTFVRHYADAQGLFDEHNKVLRWKMNVELDKFGGKGIRLKQREIPLIIIPKKSDIKYLSRPNNHNGTPRVRSVEVDNYQEVITVVSDDADKIEWILDGKIIKTKYCVVGRFVTSLSVEILKGKELFFCLIGDGGMAISQKYTLAEFDKAYQEVI
ncbi:MAG: hypothetical protein FWC80_01890 [Firmicutes bacterium]|nr:hypothetical protein [Bacillota bacterium]